ncbi:ribbon-helix-helix protein, CopG family [Achromobacter piechaudii]|uniref:ribbon-helix-helix protein, CopG family n=1 Tax=Achromobacter piechaudii TaxID=72556 RepID=UPI001C2E013C
MESGSISRQKIKSKKQQISVTIQPELLIKLDKLASALGQSRASIINIAIYHVVENGLEINKTNQLDL